MKICLANTNPFWGGGEKWFYENAVFLANAGFEVLFLAQTDGQLWQKLEAHSNIDLYPLMVGNLSFLNPFKKRWLSMYLKMTRSDALLLNSPAELKLLGPCAQKAGIPNIIYRRGSAIPVKSSAWNRKLLGTVVTHIIANSQETKKTLLTHLGDALQPEKITVIPNGIELPKLPEPKHSEVFTIGTLGRLVHQKGIDLAIQIAADLAKNGLQFQWIIGGAGKDRFRLQKQIEELGLQDQVKLLGEIKDLNAFFSSMDLYVHTARWEGFGYAIAEAMAYEKAVVAFDISSNPELIIENETGRMVPFEDITALSKAIKTLSNAPTEMEVLGKRGRERIAARFTKEKQESRLVDFLDGLDL